MEFLRSRETCRYCLELYRLPVPGQRGELPGLMKMHTICQACAQAMINNRKIVSINQARREREERRYQSMSWWRRILWDLDIKR
jgi:hypothetical protein